MRPASLFASLFLALHAGPALAGPIKLDPLFAVCILLPDGDSGVRGLVSFQQDSAQSPTRISATVRGLTPNSKHGFHIHQYGDLTQGCVSAGPHYNPTTEEHGGPSDAVRHNGDLGNITADVAGVGYLALTDTRVALFGAQSVIGRSCVVHAKEDDLGRGPPPDSKTTGNSGPRVACGVIGLASQFKGVAQMKVPGK